MQFGEKYIRHSNNKCKLEKSTSYINNFYVMVLYFYLVKMKFAVTPNP